MNSKTFQLLNLAKELLKAQPYDVSHDTAHHQQVWQTAQDITNHIFNKPNLNALKLACFWHDIITTLLSRTKTNSSSTILASSTTNSSLNTSTTSKTIPKPNPSSNSSTSTSFNSTLPPNNLPTLSLKIPRHTLYTSH